MRYLSVCSGIEAATVAWHPLGWSPMAFAEIDKFPAAVLQHHYPTIPNWGDLTKFQSWPHDPIDILVGGTPCQSFSVAGLRAGLADPRGNLALTFLGVIDRYRPRWVVWENVPGVLSATSHNAPDPCPPPPPLDVGCDGAEMDTEDEYESEEVHAFQCFLAGLSALGYGVGYRVLDAQYFGLAQRRQRVFVVGYLGDWRRAAAVLFERESLSGHPAPRREAGQNAPTLPSRRTAGGGLGTDFDCDGGLVRCVDVAPTLRAGGNDTGGDRPYGTDVDTCDSLIAQTAPTIDQRMRGPIDTMFDGGLITEPLTLAIRGRGDSHDLETRQDGTANAILTPNGGRGGIGVGAVAFDTTQITSAANYSNQKPDGPCHPLASAAHPPAIAFANTAGDTALGLSLPGAPPVTTRHGDPGNVLIGMQVRRLTPQECERLQGFPDDYTLIPYRGKPACDGPRYKALGNGMAVPVMAWIGRQIAAVDAIPDGDDEATA